MAGTVTIPNNVTVTIQAKDDSRTLKRKSSNTGVLFNVESGGKLIIKGGTYKITIDGNKSNATAHPSGAAIYSKGTITLTDVTFQNHNCGFGVVSLYGTTADNTVNNCTFKNNNSNLYCAGVYVNPSKTSLQGNKVTVTGTTFSSNEATYGGAAGTVADGGQATFTDCIVTGNKQTGTDKDIYAGGAFFLGGQTGATKLNLNNCTINSNTSAKKGGGAICVNRADDEVVINGGTIGASGKGNEATTGHGGALYVVGKATLKGGVVIQYNKTVAANMDGGGVYINGGTVTMTSATIQYNTAKDCGGGVYLTGNSSNNFNMSGGTIQNNSAGNNGGGIYIVHTDDADNAKTANVTITGGTIQSNTATSNGDGIFKNGHLTVSGVVVIKGNTGNNDVFIPTTAKQKYINIAAAGLSCGTRCASSFHGGLLSRFH